MASVAICPHCFLQLAVPDQAAPGAEIECPSCHTEFGLEKATVRAIPEGVVRGKAIPATEEPEKKSPPTVKIATFDSKLIDADSTEETAPHVISLADRTLAETEALAKSGTHADAEIAAWFRSEETVAEVGPLVVGAKPAADGVAEDIDENDETLDASGDEPIGDEDIQDDGIEDDAVTNAEDPTPMDERDEAPPSPASKVTLADWQALRPDAITRGTDRPMAMEHEAPEVSEATSDESHEIELDESSVEVELPGPSFDLPDVPLTLGAENGATVEFGSEQFNEMAAGADFELDDVDLDGPDNSWMKDDFNAAGDAHEPAHDANAQTVADVGLFDQQLRDSSYEESLQHAGEEPGTERYEHSTSSVDDGRNEFRDELPAALPPDRGARRKRSGLRTLVGAVAGAPVGLAIGYYLFLLYFGPRGDFLELAKHIPTRLLPSSFGSVARDNNSSTATPSEGAIAARPQPVEETPAEPAAKDSGNIPASYVTPVKPAAEQSAAGDDDRYGKKTPAAAGKSDDVTPIAETAHDEPRSFNAPSANALSGDEAHFIGAPLYTAAEFAATLAKAQKAEAGLVDGDLSDPAVRKVKGFSYKELCDLAEVTTYCDDPSDADHLNAMRHDAEELFQKALAAPHTREEVAQIAAIWIDSTYRKHGGIFLAGTVQGGDIVGDAYEYQLNTGSGVEMKLLSPRPLDAHVIAAGHVVGIVGSIVDNPARKISGYSGNSPRVIWVRDALPLE
jgi:hypothetical protein